MGSTLQIRAQMVISLFELNIEFEIFSATFYEWGKKKHIIREVSLVFKYE